MRFLTRDVIHNTAQSIAIICFVASKVTLFRGFPIFHIARLANDIGSAIYAGMMINVQNLRDKDFI